MPKNVKKYLREFAHFLLRDLQMHCPLAAGIVGLEYLHRLIVPTGYLANIGKRALELAVLRRPLAYNLGIMRSPKLLTRAVA